MDFSSVFHMLSHSFFNQRLMVSILVIDTTQVAKLAQILLIYLVCYIHRILLGIANCVAVWHESK